MKIYVFFISARPHLAKSFLIDSSVWEQQPAAASAWIDGWMFDFQQGHLPVLLLPGDERIPLFQWSCCHAQTRVFLISIVLLLLGCAATWGWRKHTKRQILRMFVWIYDKLLRLLLSKHTHHALISCSDLFIDVQLRSFLAEFLLEWSETCSLSFVFVQ